MFKLRSPDSFLWPVKGARPQENGGVERFSFRARFKWLDLEQVEDFQRRLMKGEVNDRTGMAELLIGWDGVGNADGTAPLEFNTATMEEALSSHHVLQALWAAWKESQSVGKEKNS